MSEDNDTPDTLDMKIKADNLLPNMTTLNENTNFSPNVYKYVNEKVD